MRYHTIPEEIEAVQFVGSNAAEIEAFTGLGSEDAASGRRFFTPEGFIVLRAGDWLVKRDVRFESCAPDVFEETYEASR